MEPENAIKLFVGGVSHDTNEQTLRDHFSKYGEVRSSEILRDRITGIARGFGFIALADNSVVDSVLNDDHVILGKKVEVKVARPKGASMETCKNMKIFVGGVPWDLTTEELKAYFEKYGSVRSAEIRHPRGFGFVTFDSEAAAESALRIPFQNLKNKRIEVKVAEAKAAKVDFGEFNGGGGVRGDYTTCSYCGAPVAANGVYIPLSYGYMPGECYYITPLNEWHGGGGLSYLSYFSRYNHSGYSRSRPVIPAQNENGNAVTVSGDAEEGIICNGVHVEDGNSEVQSQDKVDVDSDIPTKKAVTAPETH